MGKNTTQSGRGDVKSKAIIGALVTLIIAFVTIVSGNFMQNMQSRELKVRLYAELMARREEAESALRKDMFTSIIGSFLKGKDTTTFESKVLNLELLAFNFHESLDLNTALYAPGQNHENP